MRGESRLIAGTPLIDGKRVFVRGGWTDRHQLIPDRQTALRHIARNTEWHLTSACRTVRDS
jgi:hypothetical protein